MYIQVYTYYLHRPSIQPAYQHINKTIKHWYKSAVDKFWTNISLFTVQSLEIQTVNAHVLQFTLMPYLHKSIVEKINQVCDNK